MKRRNWPWILVAVLAVGCALLFILRSAPDVPSSTPTAAAAPANPSLAQPASGQRAPSSSPAPTPVARPVAAVPEPATAVDDPAAGKGIIEGRVLSFGTGLGVPNAELTFAKTSAAVTRSKNDGSFVFEPHEPGTWRLAAASAQGFLPFAPEWGHSPIAVNAVPGRRVRGITVYLTPAIDYLGLVADPDRKPVAGAEVRVLGARSGERVLIPLQDRYTTDEKGEFHFHAPDGAVLEARHARFSPGRAALDFSAQVSHRLLIKLGPAAAAESHASRETISGRVLDDKGAGLEGAVVVAETELDPSTAKAEVASSGEATSDPEGRFTLDGLDPGSYRVIASHDGLAPAEAKKITAGTRDLTLRLTKGGSLRGKVQDAETGKPVSSFVVNLWRRPDSLRVERVAGAVVVEPAGTYEIDGLPLGKLRASASAPGYAASAESDVEILASAPALADFRLTRGSRIAGTVVDRASHQPIEGARVTVEARWALGSASSAVPARPTTLTDSQGQFLLAGLAAGPLAVTAAASGHHGRIMSGLTAPESGDMSPLQIELTPTKEGEEPKLELAGIGVMLSAKGDALVIGQVVAGGGAEEAGLVAGDLLLAVDGKPVKQLGYEGTVYAIRGPEGTTLTLLVRRADGQETSIVVRRKIVRA